MAELAYREVYAMNRVEARKQLLRTYQETGSISETARLWHTSRQVVRKWVQRYEEQGEAGLADRSRRPHHSPRQTPAEIEELVVRAYQQTQLGRRRLAWYLAKHGQSVSAHTIRHILRRNGLVRPRQRRRSVYPALWAWESEQPFSLIQTDVKDIRDKGSLGTALTTHLARQRLPRYQWTACDGRTRLRFLAFSHTLSTTHGLAFLLLVLSWLRAWGVETPVAFQTDWGVEFGGDNPQRVQELSARFLAPLGGALCRYPLGRKGYNGRVERSHRTDDEEFYRPYLLQARDTEGFLRWAVRWVYVYNVLRPHSGVGMHQQPPLTVLKRLGYTGSDEIALFPPILLDPLSTDVVLSRDPEGGNDLLAHYSPRYLKPVSAIPRTIQRWNRK
jgi:putative transposase